jgi:hypothetical protein
VSNCDQIQKPVFFLMETSHYELECCPEENTELGPIQITSRFLNIIRAPKFRIINNVNFMLFCVSVQHAQSPI